VTSTAIVRAMTMVVAEPDPDWLADRSERGIDRWDEVWDGVLHVPPTPSTYHQFFERDLEIALLPLARAHGLEAIHQVSVLDPDKGLKNYRTPDLVIAQRDTFSRRGAEGYAELVVEILSPNDESREKFPFYAARRIPEYWIVDPITREIEVYLLRGDVYFAVAPNRDGVILAPRLGLELQVVEGPKLRITWADGNVEI
jgi:Uma2 family endonuclease